ncbi:hypothetical protein [Nocardia colli]|uniref:hypothetical protein n=1 Tax=Nocardia colli TaxID=2545717 RepID=UPI0035D6A458
MARVGDQSEGVTQHADTEAEFCRGVGETSVDTSALKSNVTQFCLDLGMWQRIVGQRRDQPILLSIQFLHLPLQ